MIFFIIIIGLIWTGIMYALSVSNFFLCGDGVCEWFETTILYSRYITIGILIMFFLLSNLLLAKRFQDCGICGIWVFILGISIILVAIFNFLPFDVDSFLNSLPRVLEVILAILLSVLSLIPLLYPIVLIVMCFKKGDKSKNKYGNLA